MDRYAPVDDCISRQVAMDAMDKLKQEDVDNKFISRISEIFDSQRAKQAIRLLPSVQLKIKTGRWKKCWYDLITHATFDFQCSCCGQHSTSTHSYCPNCGAKMAKEVKK